jgi:lipoprotein-anchoring transpeptidase ErfK/SrfK
MRKRLGDHGATAAKLLFTAAVLAIGIQVTGQPSATPTAPLAKPAAAAPKPRIVEAAMTTAAPAPAPAPAPAVNPDFVVKRVLPISGPLKFGDYHWDVEGVPEGQVIITVDLAAETISVFRAGYEIGAAAIIYGEDGKPTPLGVFPITQKKARHISNIYGAPMPYMMRLTNDGVAIHGSDHVEWGSATRGCIGIPVDFARLVFGQAKLGDIVIITNGKMLDMGQPIIGA